MRTKRSLRVDWILFGIVVVVAIGVLVTSAIVEIRRPAAHATSALPR